MTGVQTCALPIFMNAEDVIIAKKRKRFERIKGNPSHHSEQGPPRPKKRQMEERKDRDNKKSGPSARNQ